MGRKLHLVVGSDDRHARAFLTEEHGVHRNGDFFDVDLRRKMHLAEGAAQQASVLVGNIDFGQQGAGRWIDRLGGARHGAVEFLAGNLLTA